LSQNNIRVYLEPDNREVWASPGDNLLDILGQAGITLNAACGGAGTCGGCRVEVRTGNIAGQPTPFISTVDLASGWRQACLSRVWADSVIYIPPTSRHTTSSLPTEEIVSRGSPVRYDPLFIKYQVTLAPPVLNSNTSDLGRLFLFLEREYRLRHTTVDLAILQQLPIIIRESLSGCTVTIAREATENRIINIETGDTRKVQYVMAFDLGTTTVWGQLIDTLSGRSIAQTITLNKQITYGQDVISRIAYSQRKEGLTQLKQAAVSSLNHVIQLLLNHCRLNQNQIVGSAVAANPTMMHLLFGLDPQYIRLSPYVPVTNTFPTVKAASLGLALPPHAPLVSLPAASSWIGGDVIAGLVASGMYRNKYPSLYIDIGTNGEAILGGAEWMVGAACSAGPAFEGGGITCGMVAQNGAIEDCLIDPITLEPSLVTIGGGSPRGICGSGLISVLAGLFMSGALLPNGKYRRGLTTERLRQGDMGVEYILSWAAQNEIGRDIVFSEADVDNLLRAKAALYAGYETLRQSVGLPREEISRIYVTGGFGRHLDLEKAISIGLLPDLPRRLFIFLGNGSLSGAGRALQSRNALMAAAKTARRITSLELSSHHGYMAQYTAALFLPHTDSAQFPSVCYRLAK
jgi:uncharacterized 2Fe-2S/4Fe-4S cluster protein (DUF4445 family)